MEVPPPIVPIVHRGNSMIRRALRRSIGLVGRARPRLAFTQTVQLLVLLSVPLCPSRVATALQPPSAEQIRQYQQDGTLARRIADAEQLGNHRLDPYLASRTRQRLQRLYLSAMGWSDADVEALTGPDAAPPPAWRGGLPAKGTPKTFVLLVDFSDHQHGSSQTREDVESKFFGNGDPNRYPYESVRNFYQRSSYGQLTIGGTVFNWYRAQHARSHYENLGMGPGQEALMMEAINHFDAQGHNFAQYDNDGDGTIDSFFVKWTGPPGEWLSFWWAYQWVWHSNPAYKVDGKGFGRYVWSWHSGASSTGIYFPHVDIHETGHLLGLPDLYDYQSSVGPDGGVGGLDMMDGNWGDHNCFSKFVLEWITPTVVVSGQRVVDLQPSGVSGNCVLAMPGVLPDNPFDEFFMVQYRKRNSGNDPSSYPTDGLTLWHVDARLNASGTDYLFDNSYTTHKMLRLMEADGLEEIERNAATADAGDFYRPPSTFGIATTPNSTNYAGTQTGVIVNNLGEPGETMSVTVRIGLLPIIAPIANQTIKVGVAYQKVPTLVQGSAPVTWSLPDPNNTQAGMTIDSETGKVTWPNPGPVDSNHIVTIRAENAEGNDEKSWVLTVKAPPVVADVADHTTAPGLPYTITPALSSGSPPVTWSLVACPTGTTIDPNTGKVTWANPGPVDSSHPFTVRATNVLGSDEESWVLAVKMPAGGSGERWTVTATSPSDNITAIRLTGTPYQMGWWYGKLLGPEVRDNVNKVIAWSGLSEPELQGLIDQGLWLLMAPHIPQAFLDEIRGIVEGAAAALPPPNPPVTLTDLRRVIVLTELNGLECTSVVAMNSATHDGRLMQIRVLDTSMDTGCQDNPVITVYCPTDGPAYCNVGFAGLIGSLAGISSQGIAMSEVGIHTPAVSPHDPGTYGAWNGIPMSLLMKKVLAQARSADGRSALEHAVQIIQAGPRTTNYSYGVGDAIIRDGRSLLASRDRCLVWGLNTDVTIHNLSDPNTLWLWDPNEHPDGFSGCDDNMPALADVTYIPNRTAKVLDLMQPSSPNYVGPLNPERAITVARRVSMNANLLDVVYDVQELKLWIAYAEGTQRAAVREFVPFDFAAAIPGYTAPAVADIPNATIPLGVPYAKTPVLTQGTTPIAWTLTDPNNTAAGMILDPNTGGVTWANPGPVDSMHTVTVRARNAKGTVDRSWTLTVMAPPVIDDVPDRSIATSLAYNESPRLASGSLPVTWSLVSGPTGMTIDTNTGTVHWANPTSTGSPFTVTIRAQNPVGSDEESWKLTVATPPVIDEVPDATIKFGVPYLKTPTLAQGSLPLAWTLVTGPTGMTINPTSGTVSWPSPAPLDGSHEVTIRAENFAGGDEESWTLTVKAPPVIADVPDGTTAAGRPYDVVPVLTGGSPPVTWSLVAGPASVTIDPNNGAVHWENPGPAGISVSITVRATNVVGSDDESWSLTLTSPPGVAEVPDETIVVGVPYERTPTLTGGTPPITWSLESGPPGMTLNTTTGKVTWASPGPADRSYTVTVRATNPGGSDDESWTLTVKAPPVIAEIPDGTVVVGQAYATTPSLVSGSRPIAWSKVAGPEGMTVDPNTGMVSWAGPTEAGGPVTMTIRATNAWGSDDESWKLTSLSTPVIADVPDRVIGAGRPYVETLNAQGSVPIGWTLVDGPGGMTIDPNTGAVTWPNPGPADSTHAVTIRATNSAGFDEESWTIAVKGAPTIAPVPDRTILTGTPYVENLQLTSGSLPVQWTFVAGPAGLSVDATTGVARWETPSTNRSPFTTTVRATNAVGAAERTWTITVNDPPLAPLIKPIIDQTMRLGTPYVAPLVGLERGTPPVQWSLVAGPAGMTVDPATGAVSWPTPTTAGGPFTVTIRARNDGGQDEKSWLLTVNPQVVQVRLRIQPAGVGLMMAADGATFANSQTFTWEIGSSHALSVVSLQTGTDGTEYSFVGWSDGVDTPLRTVEADGEGEWVANMQRVTINELTVSGPNTVPERTTAQYTAKVVLSDGRISDVTQGCSWTLTPGQAGTISGKGLMTAAAVDTDVLCEVQVAYVANGRSYVARRPVTVVQVPATYSLTISTSPASAGSPVRTDYREGETVTVPVPAPPSEGMVFVRWSGDGIGTTDPLVLVMNGDKKVVAEFEAASVPTNGFCGSAPAVGIVGLVIGLLGSRRGSRRRR